MSHCYSAYVCVKRTRTSGDVIEEFIGRTEEVAFKKAEDYIARHKIRNAEIFVEETTGKYDDREAYDEEDD